MHRHAEAARDRVLRNIGTNKVIEPAGAELASITSTRQWRRPLREDEIARLAQTAEVRARTGRP